MAFSLSKLKNILSTNRSNQLAGSGSLEPEIGFKLSHNPTSRCLTVTVIGARHLPSLFGLSRAHGYLVKVKLFPGDSKFETEQQENSWPIWNEDFKFQLTQKDKTKKDLANQLAGHFISLTIYAVLEQPKPETDKMKRSKTMDMKKDSKATQPEQENKSKGSLLDRFGSLKGAMKKEVSKSLMEKRRTVGVATWNFDAKLFQNDLKNGLIGTPDIWRPIQPITSGIAGNDPRRENKKGQVEVTLLYTTSEDGLNDVIQVTVNRLRCSVTTMQEQEEFRVPLYLKAAITEQGKSDSHWKSDRFLPTISARWDPKTSTVQLPLFRSSLPNISIYISLGCKNKVGKKENLGKATIGPDTSNSESWNQCIRSPGNPHMVWLNLE